MKLTILALALLLGACTQQTDYGPLCALEVYFDTKDNALNSDTLRGRRNLYKLCMKEMEQ